MADLIKADSDKRRQIAQLSHAVNVGENESKADATNLLLVDLPEDMPVHHSVALMGMAMGIPCATIGASLEKKLTAQSVRDLRQQYPDSYAYLCKNAQQIISLYARSNMYIALENVRRGIIKAGTPKKWSEISTAVSVVEAMQRIEQKAQEEQGETHRGLTKSIEKEAQGALKALKTA